MLRPYSNEVNQEIPDGGTAFDESLEKRRMGGIMRAMAGETPVDHS